VAKLDFDDVFHMIKNITDTEKEWDTGFWINTDGIFHDDDPMPNVSDLTCHCGICHYEPTGGWIVTPWLYTMDCPAVFKTLESARKMAFFWLNWMGYIYGDGIEEPRFEADWLSVKSNRSVIMMLFEQEAEKFRNELKEEEGMREHD